MKYSAALATGALLVSSALAAPLTEQRRSRAERRAVGRSTHPMIPSNFTATYGPESDVSQVSYSSNWAGAVLVGSGYTSVTGTFTVPTPKKPSGGSSSTEYSASAWVGIDGDTCGSAILQTGLDFNVQGSSVSYDAWYEWYPDYAYDFSGISFSAGDSVTVTVTATSKTSGTAVIKNNSKGTSVSHTFTGQSGTLCEQNAEWIVEDFEEGNSLVPLANFGTVTFTGASALDNGKTVSTSGAQIIDMEQNGQVLATSSASGNTVTVTYQ